MPLFIKGSGILYHNLRNIFMFFLTNIASINELRNLHCSSYKLCITQNIAYNKSLSILRDQKFILSFSYSRRDTYIERKKDESSNDRNDRAIRVSCRFV